MKTKILLLWRHLLAYNASPWVSYPAAITIVISCYFFDKSISVFDPILDATSLESAAIVASLFFGFGPGVMAAILAGLGIDYIDREPMGFVLTSGKDYLFLLFYVAPSLLTGILIAYLRSSFQSVNKSELLAKMAVREREEMLSIVSHDLRNPLTSIMLNTQLLTRLEKQNEKSIQYLTSITRTAHYMNSLIQDMLDSSKIKAGNFVVSMQKNDLVKLVARLIQETEPLAQQKQISIKMVTDETSIDGHFDADRIYQVLSNLIGNALKFTPAGGSITIHIKRLQMNQIEVKVADTGIGIADESRHLIFNRNWQGRDGAAMGAGLGLYISKAIILAHGSDIQIASEVGKGSTFSFILEGLPKKTRPRSNDIQEVASPDKGTEL